MRFFYATVFDLKVSRSASFPNTIAASAKPTGMEACPPGTQGHLFWLGRCVTPGDKDYNRGSLSGKGR